MKTTVPALVPIDMAAKMAQLRGQSADKLKVRFIECYQGAADAIAEAAVCVKLLEEQGESLHGLPMIGTFRAIADGKVLPELYWRFLESPNLRCVERLPLADQRRLVADVMVEVAEPRPGGGYTTRKVDLIRAPVEVARLVAGPDGIRTPTEQAAQLAARKARPAPAPPAAVAEDVREPLDRRVTVRLTESEYFTILAHAARLHKNESEMIRRFLIEANAFTPP